VTRLCHNLEAIIVGCDKRIDAATPSRGAAQECSPGRKPWVESNEMEQAPKERKKSTCQISTNRAADLRMALEFVINRIDQEAMRSGQPLSDGQRLLLNNLPESSPVFPVVTVDPVSLSGSVPSDTDYESLIAVTKAAQRNDRKLNPASLDWEFALAVLKFNRHPMNWLLEWAGVKLRQPWWDRLLLVAAALLVTTSALALTFVVMGEGANPFRWVLFGVRCIAIFIITYFVSRKIEDRQLENCIEECRRNFGPL